MKKHGKYSSNKGLNMKPLAILLALTLLVGCAVGGTLAWLTAETDPVTNTFTVGDINIELAETKGPEFKIVPGGTNAKDPTITVKATSEKCHVYAYVKNNVALGDTIVAIPDINTAYWTLIGEETTEATTEATMIVERVYRYKDIVDAASADQKLPVFANVRYADTITKDDIGTLRGTKIIVDAFAHQSDNTDEATANAAALTHFGVTAVSNP